MAHMMVLNPRKRRKHGRRRMTAKQRMYFGKRRKRKTKVVTLETNPRRRRRKHRRRAHHRRRSRSFFSNPRASRRRRFARNPRRRFRRNPIGGSSLTGFLTGTLAPAAFGAAGALGIDALIANVALPQQLMQGPALPIVRIGAALLLGAAIGALSDRQTGEAVAAGA